MTFQQYIRVYCKRNLNTSYYSLNDLIQEINLSILTSPKLNALYPYIQKNEIPTEPSVLSLFKAVMSRQKMKFINKENEARYGGRKGKPFEALQKIANFKQEDWADISEIE